MKNSLVIATIAAVMLTTGCASWDTPAMTTVAYEIGNATSLAWLATSNPSATQKVEVVAALEYIKKATASITNNTFNAASLYPFVAAAVAADPKIPAADKPLVNAVANQMLIAIDLFAASHPDSFKDVASAVKLSNAFISGAEGALSLPATSAPVQRAAMSYKNVR